MEKNVNKFHLS